MASNNGSNQKAGKITGEYIAVQHYHGPLVKGLVETLSQLAEQFFRKGLLNCVEFENGKKTNQPEYQRALEVVTCILSKIEEDVQWYHVLIDILKDSSLKQIGSDIENALQEENGNRYNFLFVSGASPAVPSRDSSHQNPRHRPRSFSDSRIKELKQQVSDSEEIDSAFQELTTTTQDADQLEDRGNFVGCSSTGQSTQADSSVFDAPSLSASSSHSYSVTVMHKSSTIQSRNRLVTSSPTTDMASSETEGQQVVSVEEQTKEETLSEKSEFEPGTQGLHEIGHSHCLQKIESLKREIKDREEDIASLKAKHQGEIDSMKIESEEISKKTGRRRNQEGQHYRKPQRRAG